MLPRSRQWLADVIQYGDRILDVTADRTLAKGNAEMELDEEAHE